MIELDEMISRGWGSTRQIEIPKDWRERQGPWTDEAEELDEVPDRIDRMSERSKQEMKASA